MSTESHDPLIPQQESLIEIIRKIHAIVEIDQICRVITTELSAILDVDGVFVYEFGGQWWTSSKRSVDVQDHPLDFLEETENKYRVSIHAEQQSSLILTEATNDGIEIGKEITQLMVPITSKQKDWGLLIIHHGSHPRHWKPEETHWVQQVAFHLSIAVEHYQMYQEQQQQEQILNQAVETAIERQTTIANIIDKIRRSLNIKTILTTATEESRKLLKCHRVAVYRFNADYSGKFIAESVAEGWRSLVQTQPKDVDNAKDIKDCTIHFLNNLGLSDTYLQETQAAIFNPQDLFRVCNDIYQAEFSHCYLQLLERYQAKAYIIVAIYKNKSLWGLFAAYHNDGPRCWETTEINFMVQVGVNLGIALQQGDLLAKTQQHEQQLQTALETALKEQADTLIKINQKERSLGLVIDKIRQTLDLNTIFQTAATEMQKLLGVEHITIYRFDPSYGGQFIFESDPGKFASFAGVTWNDDYLQQTQGGRFRENEPCIIDDIQEDYRFSDCHLRILESFGVRALAIVPLFQGPQLWGLLAGFEHTHPRQWQHDEIHLLKRVAHHISVALQQSFHVRRIQEYGQEQAMMVQQERALSEVIDKIRRTLDLETIFQTAVTEVRHLLNADRVAIFKFDPDSQFALAELVSEDVTSGYPSALQEQVEDHCFAKYKGPYYQQGHVFTINDLSQADLLDCHRQILERFGVQANMVAPLLIGEELWGLICVHQCSSPRQWKPLEKGFITKIATHLSVAIQQAALLQESQQRAKILEKTLKQVQVQKQHLAEVAGQEKALARVIERIRQSLKLDSIFASTTEEVRHILNCDRVVVYRFWENWGGEFLYESLAPGWKPLRGDTAEPPIWEDTYLQETQGGRYRNQEVFWVSDIDTAQLTPCHRELLQQFQVKALLTVPVFVGEKLWGILGAYDNQKPRYWYKREIDLLKQVGNQLGVAVHQSELLRQTQEQSETLQTTLADLNAIVDNLGDGLLVADIYGRITRYNPSLVSMFNVTLPLLGKQLLDIFPEELSPLLERKKLDQKKVVAVEIPLSNNRIGQALASNIIKEQVESGEEYLGVVILIRDITKEREMERMKRNFLSMVSHELRTPLTSIVGFSSLIRDKLHAVVFPQIQEKDKKVDKAVERIKQNLDIVVFEAERLTKLVNDFLDMTKIESGKITLSLFPVKPSTVLTWAIASTAPLFEDSSVELIEDFPEELPTILGDEDRLIQVFVNLISNGFKFTETGSVTCHGEVDHDNLLISITDTGIGIAENDYSKVFEPFQQVGNILTNKPKGTGLGLSISKQIIEQHGGKIWFTSERQKGSTFFVSLPLAKDN
ncbi:probable sensory transduction histidine kinase [Crocosphaera subtropica ATCC 51142]|uniref:Circadian input-output histidine kinase CikA n=1 Tax=Crocosphaera subtropica (strain ATCC 51142 / BH68) TaxID=43989 RepID=B1WWN9_CROS5|nr:GAF domain-containing protein [Crocosphaera subtropica]ACB50763.1 probable sensory transduction histidine kinase [Crocosphaera subtropica ATCC 51142]